MIAIRQDSLGPHFVLASILAAYPEVTFQENVSTLLQSGDIENGLSETLRGKLIELKSKLADILGNPSTLDDLRSEYIDTFDRGKQLNSLYETEYGRERTMVKGTQLVDIAGFYRAFGFETGGEGVLPEMLDHVAVELEFYALLELKSTILVENNDSEGLEIVFDARKKFMRSHLAKFVGAICDRPGVSASDFYSTVFQFCRDLVMEECRRLEIETEEETWLGTDADEAEMKCGGSVGCTKITEGSH